MGQGRSASRGDAEHSEVLTGAIVLASAALFIWTGGKAISEAVRSLMGLGADIEQILMTTMLLNVALILFGYRRYRDLKQEVMHRTEAEERSRMLAALDPLTGFYNRRTFQEEVTALIRRIQPEGRAVALMMLDLDHFKIVNDVHGHAAGDFVLRKVAERIAATMPAGSVTARLGGDEFACACGFEIFAAPQIDELAEQVVDSIMRPVRNAGGELTVSTSLGIARSDRDGDTVDTLLRRADIAMYAAKAAGRNRHCWFADTMEDELHRRSAIEAGMRTGIADGEFVPYYEQQVDLTTGRLLGFEMLARWDSPALGLVSPDNFIPIAEETGMIGELSFAVMRRAFVDARNWDPSLTLSVNISPAQLRDPWLSQKLLKLLTETGFPAHRLEIEITETSLYDNIGLAKTIIGSLKNQGIRIALDDFGTGYSSLANLRALPFDRIKIDRSFVMAMNDDTESAAIVQAIARLGESLGLPVTAEGIESKDIEDQLRMLGLAKGQGWHFGKPMTVDQARRLLADRDMLTGSDTVAANAPYGPDARYAAPGGA